MIFDEDGLKKSIQNLTNKLINSISENSVFIGIDLEGHFLAKRIAENLLNATHKKIKVGLLDVNLFRPLSTNTYMDIGQSNIPFSTKNKDIILISPFIITGQSIQAALVALNDHDIPNTIKCACLLSNSNLTRPIYVDYIAEPEIDAQKGFKVNFFESTGEDSIVKAL